MSFFISRFVTYPLAIFTLILWQGINNDKLQDDDDDELLLPYILLLLMRSTQHRKKAEQNQQVLWEPKKFSTLKFLQISTQFLFTCEGLPRNYAVHYQILSSSVINSAFRHLIK